MCILAWVFVQGQVGGWLPIQGGLWGVWERHLTNATKGLKDGLDCRGPLTRSHPSNAAVDDRRLSHHPVAALCSRPWADHASLHNLSLPF